MGKYRKAIGCITKPGDKAPPTALKVTRSNLMFEPMPFISVALPVPI